MGKGNLVALEEHSSIVQGIPYSDTLQVKDDHSSTPHSKIVHSKTICVEFLQVEVS